MGQSLSQPGKLLWINPTNVASHLKDTEERRQQIYLTLDEQGFDWKVFLVAASGFFTDSYNLFATNVILSSIAYVYWPSATQEINGQYTTAINAVTLAGSAVGQLLFGILADCFGRRKLYGLELIIVIVSTLGLAQASSGYSYHQNGEQDSSMSILGWLLFYRFFQGVGIGAEYPLSAVITAEFASVKARARMMAAVFFMQPLGQVLAAVVGLLVTIGYNNMDGLEHEPNGSERSILIVDRIWRWVIGVGAIPAFVAILFRLTIPESPRYTLDVDEDPARAYADLKIHLGRPGSTVMQEMTQDGLHRWAFEHVQSPKDSNSEDDVLDPLAMPRPRSPVDGDAVRQQPPTPTKRSFWGDFWKYLSTNGNWRWLLGTCLCWFLLDFAYYGLEINNPNTLAEIWAPSPDLRTNSTTINVDNPSNQSTWDSQVTSPSGMTFPSPQDDIFYSLKWGAVLYIITSCVGSLVGSLLLIKLIPYIPRRPTLYWSFIALFVLLIVNGATYFKVVETSAHAITIVFYILIQIVFNFGPNSLVFIISAEIFPTRFRATCYGISAAAGKIASVIVTTFLPYARFRGTSNTPGADESVSYGIGQPNSTGLYVILIIFSFVMLMGAGAAWFFIPEVQHGRGHPDAEDNRLPSKTLEELAEGRRPKGDEEKSAR